MEILQELKDAAAADREALDRTALREIAGDRQGKTSEAEGVFDGVWSNMEARLDTAGIIEGTLLQWHIDGTVSPLSFPSRTSLLLFVEAEDLRFQELGNFRAATRPGGKSLREDGEVGSCLCKGVDTAAWIAKLQAKAGEWEAKHAAPHPCRDGWKIAPEPREFVYQSAMSRPCAATGVQASSTYFTKYRDGTLLTDPKCPWVVASGTVEVGSAKAATEPQTDATESGRQLSCVEPCRALHEHDDS